MADLTEQPTDLLQHLLALDLKVHVVYGGGVGGTALLIATKMLGSPTTAP